MRILFQSRTHSRCSTAMLFVVGVLAVLAVSVGQAQGVGVWGQAAPVVFAPGVQSSTPNASLQGVACGSAGNCTAVGRFTNVAGGSEAFTVTSFGGVWGEVALSVVFAVDVQNATPDASLNDVACGSAGNCTAVGQFKNVNGGREGFTVTSTNGAWGQATPVVFASGVQNTTPNAYLDDVVCGSAGDCTAVGRLKNVNGRFEGFSVTSTGGAWGQATPVVFASDVQNVNPFAGLNGVACGSAGNCTAAGFFTNVAGYYEGFTVSSTGGAWGMATPVVFASGVQNTTPNASLNGVACGSAGNCTAVGGFRNANGGREGFTVTSIGGAWGQATAVVFASGVQNTNPNAYLKSVACGSAGNCTAVGGFRNANGDEEGFTVTSIGGVWGVAMPVVFAVGVQSTAPDPYLDDVACGSAGNCTAAGGFKNVSEGYEGFTVTSIGGVWGEATQVVFASGVQNTNPDTSLNGVACGSAGNCTAVGYFVNVDGYYEAFTVTSVENIPAPTTTVAPTAKSTTVRWKVSSLKAGQVKRLSAVASTNSPGVKTWSKTGSCTLKPTRKPTTLTMGATGSCTLTLKIAKSGKYPAKTSTNTITLKS